MKTVRMLLVATVAAACSAERPPEVASGAPAAEVETASLVEVASSAKQWTGLTMSEDGRLFVNYPRWSADVPVSVAEIVDGEPMPYPDTEMNSWTADRGDAAEQFVCVQSVVADGHGSLWILDPANAGFRGVVEGGAKLIRMRLETSEAERVYRYAAPVIKASSYLNDVRIDLDAGFAYITDSGDGAIIVTNLESGESRRLLDDHVSTEAEDVVLTIEGNEWRLADGSPPKVHADGIALTPDRNYLYYQALTGRTLYRIPTAALRDETIGDDELSGKVETAGDTGAADGLIFGRDGRLYISALEENAIRRFDPATGDVEIVVRDERIKWPDTFTLDPRGRVMFTTAQIHLGAGATEPYRIFRIEQGKATAERR